MKAWKVEIIYSHFALFFLAKTSTLQNYFPIKYLFVFLVCGFGVRFVLGKFGSDVTCFDQKVLEKQHNVFAILDTISEHLAGKLEP